LSRESGPTGWTKLNGANAVFFRRSKARFKEFSKFLASETTVYALLEA